MTSTIKKTKLSDRSQDYGNTFKKLKYDTTSSSETDKFDFISKLKRLRDIEINPINKEKTSDLFNKLNDHSDVTVYRKPIDKISNMKRKQVICDSCNTEAQKKTNLKQRKKLKVAKNYKPCIMKVVEEMKRTLSKFNMQLNNLQVKNLKNKIVDPYDAKDIIFIIGCIISKLKEELKDKEELLRMPYLQKNIQHNSKQSHLYKYGKLHHNHNRKDNSQSKISLRKRSLNNATKINNANGIQHDHDHVSIEPRSEKSFTSTTISGFNDNVNCIQNDHICVKRKVQQNYNAINKTNEKIAFWNKRNDAYSFSGLTVIENTAKNTKKSDRVTQSSQNDNLKTIDADWKHSGKVGPVPEITKANPTKTKEDSLGNKLPTKNTQCVQLNDVSDTCSTSSTIFFLPIEYNNVEKVCKDKSSIIGENKSKLCDGPYTRSLGTCTGRKSQLTSCFCYSEETVIPKNTKHDTGTCNEKNASKNSTRNTKMDWDVELVNSSISTTFSANILPSISPVTKDGNLSEIYSETTKRNGGTMNKMFMTCQVVLHKLQV